jgi:tetratricopeptide (TPR) repeat protein
MKKELKRQIKQDELVSGYQHAAHWLAGRKDEVRITVLVAAALVLGFVGLRAYQNHRKTEAERALGEAMALYQAPVTSELPEGAPPPPGPVHPSAQEKYTRSAAAFQGVASRHGSTAAGRRARYFEALCRIELGDYAEGEKALKEIAARRDDNALEPGLARLALAEAHRRQAKLDQALDEYKQIVDSPASEVPRDHSLMRLAGAYEEARRLPEAGAAYRRLVEEFPTSVYASEARRRADYLGTDSRS